MLNCIMENKKTNVLLNWKATLKTLFASLKNRQTKLSHKKVRAFMKKEKRKVKRQLVARERDAKLGRTVIDSTDQLVTEEDEYSLVGEYQERERRRLHYLWLKREEQAQREFVQRKEQREKDRIEKEIQIQKNLEELEKLEEKERSGKPAVSSSADKEGRCQDLISKLPEGSEPWHNPIAPLNFIMKEQEQCMFFTKTGACRFGERCSRSHERPPVSCTILIHGMFRNFGLDQAFRDEYDTDLMLEYEDSETYQHFKDFYEDVLPEFKKLGKVVQFKVCCNQEPHLKGNVYVQFDSEEEASAAYRAFNGRWYASRQLTCEFCPVTQWKQAICGLFHSKRCPKGRTCNFLHVFRNPTNEFWLLDRGDTPRNNSSHRQPHDSQSRTPDSSRKRRRPSNTPESSHGRNSRTKHQRPFYRHRHSRRSRSRSPESMRSRRSRSSSVESPQRRRTRSPKNSSRKRSQSPSYSRRQQSPPSSRSLEHKNQKKLSSETENPSESVPTHSEHILTEEFKSKNQPEAHEDAVIEKEQSVSRERNTNGKSRSRKKKRKHKKKRRRSSSDSSSDSRCSSSPKDNVTSSQLSKPPSPNVSEEISVG